LVNLEHVPEGGISRSTDVTSWLADDLAAFSTPFELQRTFRIIINQTNIYIFDEVYIFSLVN